MSDPFLNIINDVYRLQGTNTPDHIEDKLNKLAKQSNRKQSRICMHQNNNDLIHIMYICHLKKCHVRIHKHTDNPEWIIFHKAKAKLVYYDDNGIELNQIDIDTKYSGSPIIHFIPKGIFHTFLFEEDSYFLEVKQGPFKKNQTIFLDS